MRNQLPPKSLHKLPLENSQTSHLLLKKIGDYIGQLKKKKEGVEKFSTKVIKNLPWKKVLEFGCHVFYPTCTPSDLKDKRRNIMAKAISRSYVETIASKMGCLACITIDRSKNSRIWGNSRRKSLRLHFQIHVMEYASMFFFWSLNINFVSVFGLSMAESLIPQTVMERLIRRSLRLIPIPNMPNSPVPDPGHNEQG
ncbi:hypothetical protein WN943_011357 [Citrus x changshan-huyou]